MDRTTPDRDLEPPGRFAPRSADYTRFQREAGSSARIHLDDRGQLRLASRLELDLSSASPDALLDQLFARYPVLLPTPAGLEARTRSTRHSSIQVITRTWQLEGVPVEGLSISAHVDARGRVILVSVRGLNRALERPVDGHEAGISKTEAEARAYAVAAQLPGISPARVFAARGLEAGPDGLRWIWRVGVEAVAPGVPLEVRLAHQDGALIGLKRRAESVAPAASSAASVVGNVYESSPLAGQPVQKNLSNLTNGTHLTGKYVDVYNLQFTPIGLPIYDAQTATPTSTTSDTTYYDYDPIEVYNSEGPTAETQSDPFAEVMMYYHVDRVHGFFNQLGYFNDDPSTGIDRPMRSTVNYRSYSTGYYNNAYYSPPANSSDEGEIVFGQGEETDFTYDASVIYHEYTHAVVDGTSDYLNACISDSYGTDCTQGGLNEGTADYFAATLGDDPGIGQYAIGEWLPEYARDLTDPNRCPDDLYGEEHEDGKIWGGGLWDVRTALTGGNADEAHDLIDPIILAAISTPLPETPVTGSAFSDATEILLTDAGAAMADGTLSSSQLKAIEDALTERGLTDCDRFVPMHNNETRYGAFSTAGAPKSIVAAGLQYVVSLSDSAEGFTFTIGDLSNATIYVRRDQPVSFVSSEQVDADFSSVATSATIDASASFFEPGHDYYISFTTQQTLATAFYGTYYSVVATVIGDDSFESSDPSGCGCVQERQARAPIAGAALGLAAAALLVGRRRRA